MLKSLDMVLQHVGVEPTQEGSRCPTFRGNFVNTTEQNVTVGESATEGAS